MIPKALSNLTKVAIQKREERLEEEYQHALQAYVIKYREYEKEVAKRKQKFFLVKMFSQKPTPPQKL